MERSCNMVLMLLATKECIKNCQNYFLGMKNASGIFLEIKTIFFTLPKAQK
jgi:hypothetical protein